LETPPKDFPLRTGGALLSLKMRVLALSDTLSLDRTHANN